jgi:Na+/proline symporter
MQPNSKVGAFDYIVMVGILLITIIIGIFFGYKKDLMKKFKRRGAKSGSSNLPMMSVEAINVDEKPKVENNDVANYLTADKSMGILPIAFSLVATNFSSNSILANPGNELKKKLQSH